MELFNGLNLIHVVAFANAMVLFATAALLRGWTFRNTLRREEARPAEPELEARLLAALDEITRRLDAVEGFARVAARPPEPMPVAGAAEPRYGEALRLVGGGARPGDLVSRCGLSRGEADLLVRLHGNRHRGEALLDRKAG